MLTDDLKHVVLALMEDLDCARSLTVTIMLRYNELDGITQLNANPRDYSDSESYWRAAVASDLLRKFTDFDLGIDLEQATLQEWKRSESQCFRTNVRLRKLVQNGPFGGSFDPALGEFFSTFRKNLQWLIGSSPGAYWESGRFGPGATVSDSGSCTSVPDKLSSVPTLTPHFPSHVIARWRRTAWAGALAYERISPIVRRENVYFTVPKHSRIKRPCCLEPSLNAHYQLALGTILKERLGKRGFDLYRGQARHARYARSSSLDESLVTIDLKSASDTVARTLVEFGFPPRWSEALQGLRARFTRLPSGESVLLEKFSSMGNGFTFEVETAIFASLALSVDPTLVPGVDLFVYGDDIIVPKRIAEDLLKCLEFFGFTPNPKKTFLEGPFRESCGEDYFNGVRVRPHFVEDPPATPSDWFGLCNGLRRACTLYGGELLLTRWNVVRRAWRRAIDNIPTSLRVFGPAELGDVVIHDYPTSWRFRLRSSGIWFLRVYRPVKPATVRWEGYGYETQFAAALYGVSPCDKSIGPPVSDRRIPTRGRVSGYKLGWTPFS